MGSVSEYSVCLAGGESAEGRSDAILAVYIPHPAFDDDDDDENDE